MKIYRVLLAFISVAAIGFNGCSTAPEDTDAQQITVSELSTSIGYSWFRTEANLYKDSVDMNTVKKIADAFNVNKQKMYVFVRPTCSCNGTQHVFPRTLEVLNLAGVPDSMIIVYSMSTSATKHPMMNKFSIGGLPSFFITKGESTVYVMQTLNEKLYANSPNKTQIEAGTRKIEDMVLEGFSQ
jgi:hypothetical protein